VEQGFCEQEVTSCLHEGESNCLEAVPARREITISISSSGSSRERKTYPPNRLALHKNSYLQNNGLALNRNYVGSANSSLNPM
jgi:hypothetical protein